MLSAPRRAALAALWLLCGALGAWAQSAWCRSYADFRAARWDTLATPLTLRSERGNALAYDLRGARSLRRHLLREAFAISVNGTPFINLRPMTWWGPVLVRLYVLGDGTLLFARPDVTNDGGLVSAYGSTMRPFNPRALRSPSRLENLVCYRLVAGSREGEMGIDKVDERWMRARLERHAALLAEYTALRPARRDAADVVLDLLQRAGQLTVAPGGKS